MMAFRFTSREKIKELHEWMVTLESEKFDHMERQKRQKYEVSVHPGAAQREDTTILCCVTQYICFRISIIYRPI